VNFFLALAETALFSLGKLQARRLAEQSPTTGRLLARLLAAPQDVLATIGLGTTFANAVMLTAGLWQVFHGGWPLGWTVLWLLILFLVGCEVVPKTLAVRRAEYWSLRVARPMLFLVAFTGPVRRIAQALNARLLRAFVPATVQPRAGMTDADYQELLELAFHQGALAAAEKEIILQIISLDRRTVKEVMQPRARMHCIPDDLPVEDMIAEARRSQHSRLPMYDESPDTIVGVLNTQALLLDPHIDLADAIEFPSFVPETMNLLQLLKSLQRQRRGMAIVLDEYGGVAGLVTMEDILSEIIGRIREEDAAGGFVMEKLGPGRWRVSGLMRLDDFRREYPQLGDAPEVETMGGLMAAQMEVVPREGESVNYRGLRLTARAGDERRVRELLVETTGKRGAG
jgi:CBS domain containing-hemolysin-like protein